MPVNRTTIGLPSQGINRSGRNVVPFPEALDKWYALDINGLRFNSAGRLQAWPAVSAYANTFNAFRVTKLANVKWGDGTSDIVRHSRGANATGFGGFCEQVGGVWVSRSAAINLGVTDEPWGGAVTPGNTGKGYYVFTNRVATTGGPWAWGGAAADAAVITNASPGRFVVNFADRCFIFNQLSGGVVQSRRSQWSVPGDSTTWTGTGSGNRTLSEISGDITGASPLRQVLIVYGPNTTVIGEEQYIANAPIRYTVFSRGMGNWAWPSLVVRADKHYMLTQKGFRSFDGNDFAVLGGIREADGDIKSPIDAYILDNINRNALGNVVAYDFDPWQTIVWGLPMGTSTEVSELWAFNTQMNTWTRLDASPYFASPLTAACVVDQTSAPAWNDAGLAAMLWDGTLATDGTNRAGRRWIDEAGAGTKPVVITGHSDGVTRTLDETAFNKTVKVLVDTPAFTLAGAPLFPQRDSPPTGRILDDDIKVLDRIALRWRTTFGGSYIHIYASVDGGQTYTYLGRLAMATGVGSQLNTNFITSRISGPTVSLRFTNTGPAGVNAAFGFELEDIALGVRRAGEIRGAA